ncbi:hypothetical protein RA210_U30278 [Rubrivivax sp. A210]|nr:hypothetical protein RA210_U30278 [Rubrivivax sp. A210]
MRNDENAWIVRPIEWIESWVNNDQYFETIYAWHSCYCI